MIMQKLMKEVNAAAKNEYHRAAAKYGLLHFVDHQSIAVLAEEVEEARDELAKVIGHTQEFWNLVKSDAPDEDKLQAVKQIEHCAKFLACEAIQVVAMAYKAKQTIKHRGEQ